MNDAEPNIYRTLRDNLAKLRELLHDPDDLVTRVIKFGGTGRIGALVCVEGVSDKTFISEQLIPELQRGTSTDSDEDFLGDLTTEALSTFLVRKIRAWDDVIQAVLDGDSVLFVQGAEEALLIGSQGWVGRTVEEPTTEALIRGPREGFTEEIGMNVALIRRGLRDRNLAMDRWTIGRRSRKKLVLMYIEGIVHPDIVAETKRRLDTIDIDDAPETGYIEQWIEDSFLSPFPQILHTERPDKARAALLQGKAIILLDGTPFSLILPTTFVALLQSPEDYYERWMIGSLIRLLRYFAVFISLFLPSLYIALVSYHQGMIPFKLTLSIAAAREGVPFPAFIEALLMEGTLELLREAGVRLPKPIGQTIGVVGGLVIGEAAVQAGIVSPIMVIVVAVTAIASFSTPSYSASIAFRMLRFATMLSAGILGLFGIILSFIMICIHLVRLKSFGVPYAAPYAPLFLKDWGDLFIRLPLTFLNKRPNFMQTKNVKRASGGGRRR
ncbi:spore germination protein [Paenibacillaceae bacterium WGS1546]|uniref:spore germination protein n=1 Tax=Cohnella sp. WGS1546 TaxID=3366810 RepID=UPI00372D3689